MEQTDTAWRAAPAGPAGRPVHPGTAGAAGAACSGSPAGTVPAGAGPSGGRLGVAGGAAGPGAAALQLLARPSVRRAAVPVALGALGAALCCWGLALCGYWTVAFALYGKTALPAASPVMALGLLLAAAGGASLAGTAAALRGASRADGAGPAAPSPPRGAGRILERGYGDEHPRRADAPT